jgi:DnaJ-class molecular chaperone
MAIITCTTCLGQKTITIGLSKNKCPTCDGHGHFDNSPKKSKNKKVAATDLEVETETDVGSENGSD